MAAQDKMGLQGIGFITYTFAYSPRPFNGVCHTRTTMARCQGSDQMAMTVAVCTTSHVSKPGIEQHPGMLVEEKEGHPRMHHVKNQSKDMMAEQLLTTMARQQQV